MASRSVTPGRAAPPGVSLDLDGANFSLYSQHATEVELVFFDQPTDSHPMWTATLDPRVNCTDGYWHVHVSGVKSGQLYGYRVAGPAQAGLRFDRDKLLVDPYALAVANTERCDRLRAAATGDNIATALKSVVVDPTVYDWEGDTPLQRDFVDAAIYELHVAGFTRNPNSGVAEARRGTYLGLIEKIPYLVELGIKAVELMPVQQFDSHAAPNGVNYWGYQPIAWLAPHRGYCASSGVLAPVDEFRDLVKALHRAGIAVILDVVFNHTAEGDAAGPTLSLRGIDNPTYYLLDATDPTRYTDDTGCGNTIQGNQAVVRRLIVNCLRYWVEQMHVDGFRFDLAASLSRGEDGKPLARPPLLMDIEADPVLADTKIIAEAWDAAGLYQIANFGGDRWAVWNGDFRDHVRRFLKGEAGMVGRLADNLVGSATLFEHANRLPSRSVNFVTAHDGFTLNDLVTYNDKHNEANGEGNRDGAADNASWNCGVEGPTDDPAIETLRCRQIRNFLTILLMSEGRPMLLMGDEVRRTQRGNNNAYCHDDELAWFDWDDIHRHGDMHRFVRLLLQFHQSSAIFRDRTFWGDPGATRIVWHGIELAQPDWSENSHALAYELWNEASGEHMHVILNAFWEPLDFALPAVPVGRAWRRLVDTTHLSPNDICNPPAPLGAAQTRYHCGPRAAVVLVSQANDAG